MTNFEQFITKETPGFNLFVDLDGVLVNWQKAFKELTGTNQNSNEYEDEHGVGSIWKLIGPAGQEWWENLEWMPDGKFLWGYVKGNNPTILSAPSRDISSKLGKIAWLERELPDLPNHKVQTKAKKGWDGDSKIILNSLKYRYATGPQDILIDDTDKKIDEWNNAGGTGILHTSASDTIGKLKELGL